ncbi:MAG: hypothetical protein O9322_01520 [Beijerinckiaceae bacterium]|nr:hypothetical protein [Beijerinckiaceae bacterium]MCZ8301942.1 hypothetical protein [Beijerinckiaceae bacterium]
MGPKSKDIKPPAVSLEREHRNIRVNYVYSIYYFLDELSFLSDEDYVKRAWRGEIDGVCTSPNDGYNDIYAFSEIDDAVDYFVPIFSLTEEFQEFTRLHDEMVLSPQFQSDSGHCDIEKYLASPNFHQLVEAAQTLHSTLCTKLTENGIDIERLRTEIIAAGE